MKPFIICILFSLIHYNIYSQTSNNTISIIPIPNSVVIKEGNFTINNKTFIYFNNKESKEIAELFKEFMLVNYNLDLIVGNKMQNSNCIQFISSIQDNKEAYELLVTEKNIIISGENAGLFYGYQSLIQLLPIAKQTTNLVIPSVEIKDEPRFGYRGMHLDVSRHFFPIEYIKKYIDYIALHKMNTFHWHLTDDQGWRIEIKKYPKLTSVGGFRNGTIVGRYPGKGNTNKHYGGFYTQVEVKEIVAYAAKRYITVIPEIEMPGHASAAIAAYPQLSCFPEAATKYPPRTAWNGDTTQKNVQRNLGCI
jgi:hexosaminidase